MAGDCAKKIVIARLTTKDGQIFFGKNDVKHPQEVCPRIGTAARDDYRLCHSVCGAQGHAEINAFLRAARTGAKLTGAHMTVWHHRVCPNCQTFLKTVGITWEVIKNP
jgi:deoxycytidylate deaminase